MLIKGELKELHAATGGAWGGVLVNSAFEAFITQLVSNKLYLLPCKTFCKTINICGINFLRFNDNDILTYFNFGCHDLE